MPADAKAIRLPAVPFLRIDADGHTELIGSRCTDCGVVVPGTRAICIACGAQDRIEPILLSKHGHLYSFTIVHRSFPGVKTPFVAAIVNLEGGGTLKGTLVDVEPLLEKLRYDMPVAIVFRDTGQKTTDGIPFLSYYFVPAERPFP